MVCDVCYQPECKLSSGGARPAPASHSSILEPGQHEYRGYQEWAVHPLEAIYILHRGYAIVNGDKARVAFIHNEAHVTQILVDQTFAEGTAFEIDTELRELDATVAV